MIFTILGIQKMMQGWVPSGMESMGKFGRNGVETLLLRQKGYIHICIQTGKEYFGPNVYYIGKKNNLVFFTIKVNFHHRVDLLQWV